MSAAPCTPSHPSPIRLGPQLAAWSRVADAAASCRQNGRGYVCRPWALGPLALRCAGLHVLMESWQQGCFMSCLLEPHVMAFAAHRACCCALGRGLRASAFSAHICCLHQAAPCIAFRIVCTKHEAFFGGSAVLWGWVVLRR